MELKAKHILVGSFVLISILSLFVFAGWLAKVQFDRKTAFFEIYFESSVSGLSPAGDVRYRGINVGAVQDIHIDPDNPERVRVLIMIDATFPIRKGDKARLELQGITGVSYINIEGAAPGAEILSAAEGSKYPVIPFEPSQFEKLALGAPALIASSTRLADRAGELLNTENRRLANGILTDVARIMASISTRTDKIENIIDSLDLSGADIAQITGSVASRTKKIENIIDSLDQSGTNVAQITASVASRTGKIENLIDNLDQSGADVVESVRLIRQAASETNALIADLKSGLSDARGTLAGVDDLVQDDGATAVMEFRYFLAETRHLIASITRITEHIENDPSGFIFGVPEAEYEAK